MSLTIPRFAGRAIHDRTAAVMEQVRAWVIDDSDDTLAVIYPAVFALHEAWMYYLEVSPDASKLLMLPLCEIFLDLGVDNERYDEKAIRASKAFYRMEYWFVHHDQPLMVRGKPIAWKKTVLEMLMSLKEN